MNDSCPYGCCFDLADPTKIGGGFGGTVSGSDGGGLAVANGLFDQAAGASATRTCPANDENEVVACGRVSHPEMNVPLTGAPAHPDVHLGIGLGALHAAVEYEEGRSDREDEVYYYHSDHLGSASWITDGLGSAVQHLQYLPYGEPFVDQRTAGYAERFTFAGKERDEETGYGYFGARYMDHELLTSWLSVDPMTDKYPGMSPYAYCAWNPVKLVDPDGREMNPVFGLDGSFKGCTKEGYTGEIIIYDGDVDFLNMTKEELYRASYEAMPYSLVYTTMKDDAKSRMYTHIVSQYEGKDVLGTIFSMNEVHDNQIKFDGSKSGNWCTTYGSNGQLGENSDIFATDRYLRSYEATVENIQSSVIFHEWFSHKIQGCSDARGNHQQAYQNVMNSPLWTATTQKYREFNEKKFQEYDGR